MTTSKIENIAISFTEKHKEESLKKMNTISDKDNFQFWLESEKGETWLNENKEALNEGIRNMVLKLAGY